MAERWVVTRSTGVVAKKTNVRGVKDIKQPMYFDCNEFKPRPPNIPLAQRKLKDPFNVLWPSGDEF